MKQTAATGSKHIKNYFLLPFVIYLSGFYVFFKIPYCFKIPLMASFNILCSDPYNFLNEITKKNKKEAHKKIFCDLLKISKNISWPLQKSSGPPPTYLMQLALAQTAKKHAHTERKKEHYIKIL